MLPVINMFSHVRLNNIPFTNRYPAAAIRMNSNLTVNGINLLEGFVITAEAFRIFLRDNNLQLPLSKILQELDTQEFSNIDKIGKAARQLVLNNELPHKLEIEIKNAHYKLCGEETDVSVAIRSCATTEDSRSPAFTQPLESFLNISGEDALLNAVHKCFVSLFSDSAIRDRHNKGIKPTNIAISITVEKTKRTHYSSSNQTFPIDPLKGFNKIMSFKTVEKV